MSGAPTSDWVKTMQSWPYTPTDAQARDGDEPVDLDEGGDKEGTDGDRPEVDARQSHDEERGGEDDGCRLDDPGTSGGADTQEQTSRATRRFDPKIAMGLAGAAMVALFVTIAGATYAFRSSDKASEAVPAAAVTPVPPPAAPTSAADTQQGVDKPLAYDAECLKCPKGSSVGQSIATGPLIVVRKGLEGQVIKIYLGSKAQPRSSRITGIVFEPGILTPDAHGKDQYSQHLCVKFAQFNFNDAAHTVIPKDTECVHGEVSVDVPNVLASQITIIIRHTSRPPKTPPTTGATVPSGQGGIVSAILGDGTPTADDPDTGSGVIAGGEGAPGDPVDATFAMSNLKILGHEPL